MTNTEIPQTFQVGSTYSARSAGDHNCVWTFEVVRRSAKFITLRDVDSGETMRVGVRLLTVTSTRGTETAEVASPFGSYSMAPVVRAGAW